MQEEDVGLVKKATGELTQKKEKCSDAESDGDSGIHP